jgi:ABC-type antimicrobial peptide transport system permease subunit
MIRFAVKGLAGRKLRSALTALAIVLGVAMVSGTYVLTDTIDRAFSQIFDEAYAGTDAVVTGRGADISFQGLSSQDPPIPASLLEPIRALPGVEAAGGAVSDETNTKILTKDGKAINTQGAPSFGLGFDTSPELERFNPLNLLEGRWPRSADEVVIDVGTADRHGYAVGERVEIATLKPRRSFEIVGTARYGELDSLGTATFVVFELAAAQELLNREDQFDAISVAAREGTTPAELVREIEPVIPATARVRSAQLEADEDKDEINEFTSFIEYFLLAFAGIALFVGAFVIFNTLSITVAQRTREFATLRTIGAARRQVLGAVVLEALVIGLLASIAGLFGGLALANGLQALFQALDLDLPRADTVFAPRTVVVSLLVGVLVTLLAGLFPAIRATRVPPIAAVREGATLPPSRLAPLVPWLALTTVALAIALLTYAMFRDELGTADRLLAIAGGVLLLFVGVALLSPRLVRPLASWTHPVAKWVVVVLSIVVYPATLAFWLLRYGAFSTSRPRGRRAAALIGGAALSLVTLPLFLLAVPVMWLRSRLTRFRPEWPMEVPNVRTERQTTEIARENARRNPGRTAATAAALMIGLALVTFVAVLANGMKASNRGAIEDQVLADYVVTSQDGFTPFVAAAGDAVGGAAVAELSTSVRSDLGKIGDSDGYVTGIEPGTIAAAYGFDWKEGSAAVLGQLGRNGAILDSDFAEEHDLAVGDTVRLLSGSNRTARVQIKAIYEPPPFYPLLGSLSIPQDTFDSLYERPRNQFTFVNVPGDPTDETTAALELAASDYPDAKVQTREAWIDQQDADFNQFLTMLYVLLALSVIVSLFGMVNTLVLSVFERTRELGMLRAVAMTQRQARRMVRHESVITALIGAVLGLPLGVFLAALVTRALQEFEVQFALPVSQLIVFAIVAAIVGIVAAVLPARRAARLNVLQALQYE